MTSDRPAIRVLLVDDHEMVVESFRRVLAAEPDIEVVGMVGTARRARSAALELRPDVVLMDHLLPDGNGAATAARMLEEMPELKIVMLTGSDVDNALDEALEAGCIGFVEKTSALDKLAPAVRMAAAGQLVLPPNAVGRILAISRRTPTLGRLSPREHEILVQMAAGLSNKRIAENLVLSVHTVRTHVQTILSKLGAHSKLEAVAEARKRGLLA